MTLLDTPLDNQPPFRLREDVSGGMNVRVDTRKRNGRVSERGYNSRPSTDEMTEFLRKQALRYSEKELQTLTGLGAQGVKKIRAGQAAAGGQTITAWCRACPDFRLAYFMFVGGQLETDPGFAAALSKTIQEWMRANG